MPVIFESIRDKMTIKVASYNIHKAVGTDRRRNPGRIIDVLNEMDADVIALQEADRRFGNREAAIPPLLLEQNSDYLAIPLDVQTDSIGWHGNAILVRKGSEVLAHDILHIPCIEPRGAVTASVVINGARVNLVGMHLDLSGLWRGRQAAAIIKIADTLTASGPTVLLGDLNEWSVAGGSMKVFLRHYAAADCGRSFHARQPVAMLDRIMHCDKLSVVEAGVHQTATSRKASDHLPIWAQFSVS